MAKRNVFAVPVDAGDSAIVDADCLKSGMGKAEFFRRLLRWYSAQDDVVRGTVMATVPESVAVDVAKLVLERLAAGKPVPTFQKIYGSVGTPPPRGNKQK